MMSTTEIFKALLNGKKLRAKTWTADEWVQLDTAACVLTDEEQNIFDLAYLVAWTAEGMAIWVGQPLTGDFDWAAKQYANGKIVRSCIGCTYNCGAHGVYPWENRMFRGAEVLGQWSLVP